MGKSLGRVTLSKTTDLCGHLAVGLPGRNEQRKSHIHMLNLLKDVRSNCLSLMVTVSVDDYITLIEKAYEDQGGVRGQRAPIKTKTGLSIRRRMIDDICRGAVLPDLPLNFHPVAIRASAVDAPFSAG